MLFDLFRKTGSTGLEAIAQRTISMLSDARHSFDLACAAAIGGADVEAVAADIRATDERINVAEQELRRELVTHIAVQGPGDIGPVLSSTLLIKKIERIGDQAKNILDLAEEGISLAGQDDTPELLARTQQISAMFADAAELLASGTHDDAEAFYSRCAEARGEIETIIRELLHSTEPARDAVPRAILYRYWKRIVANLSGVVTSAIEPLEHDGYREGGTVDLDD